MSPVRAFTKVNLPIDIICVFTNAVFNTKYSEALMG